MIVHIVSWDHREEREATIAIVKAARAHFAKNTPAPAGQEGGSNG